VNKLVLPFLIAPMHPEIRQDHAENCPKCGMTLEHVLPCLVDAENTEQADFMHRLWWTLPLTVSVAVMAMFGHLCGWMPMGAQSWLEFALSVPVARWAGWPFFVRGRSRPGTVPQHVDADQQGHRLGLRLQRGDHRRPARVPGLLRLDGWCVRHTGRKPHPGPGAWADRSGHENGIGRTIADN
jgi:hypothetical protein